MYESRTPVPAPTTVATTAQATPAQATPAQAATFRASLRPAARGAGSLFVAGDFDAYDLENLTDRARRGIDSVRIVVRGLEADAARQRMSPSIERLRRHGVRVTVVAG